jgi:hypothetical protein
MTGRQKLYLTNISVSVLLFIILTIVRYYLVVGFSNLFEHFGKFIGGFSITYLDLAIIATIPLWTIPIYSKFKTVNKQTIVLTNVFSLLILFVTLVLSYIIGDFFADTSPFLPLYVISPPFEPYFTFSLCLGCALTFAVFRLYQKLTTK